MLLETKGFILFVTLTNSALVLVSFSGQLTKTSAARPNFAGQNKSQRTSVFRIFVLLILELQWAMTGQSLADVIA